MKKILLAVLVSFLAGAAVAAPIPFSIRTSAYCGCAKCCGKWSKYGKTKSGTVPRQGHTIAADPRVFPLGTCLRIGDVRYRVEDVGSAIKGLRVDVFHSSHVAAVKYGRKTLLAYFC